jgi:hypothetical protein
MSSSIWTRCAGASERRPLRVDAWRVVEAQHQVSTRKLVDTAEEQALLEELIDRVKPPDPTAGAIHYLVFTPFRYPPLRHGSRFGTRRERGIWYGSESRHTALTEVAYYRLLFLDGSSAALEPLSVELTAIRARARTQRGIDLTKPPFESHRRAIASPASYAASQALGAAMRADGVEVFRYPSARDSGGVNVGIFAPSAFGRAAPRDLENWRCTADRSRVEFVKRDYFERATLSLAREQFLVDGALPVAGV